MILSYTLDNFSLIRFAKLLVSYINRYEYEENKIKENKNEGYSIYLSVERNSLINMVHFEDAFESSLVSLKEIILELSDINIWKLWNKLRETPKTDRVKIIIDEFEKIFYENLDNSDE